MKITRFGKVDGSKLKISNRYDFEQELAAFFEGKDVIVTVERKTRKRTLSQNDYLHAMLRIFTAELNNLGNTFIMEQVKDMMKYKFLTVDVVNTETGEALGQRVKDTSELTTTELSEFIEEVIRYAAEFFHIVLPYPNEQMEIAV